MSLAGEAVAGLSAWGPLIHEHFHASLTLLGEACRHGLVGMRSAGLQRNEGCALFADIRNLTTPVQHARAVATVKAYEEDLLGWASPG